MKEILCRLLAGASWLYLALLFLWLAAYLLRGDKYALVALANLTAVYLFFPLPMVLLSALLCRSRWLGLGFTLGTVTFLVLWGGQFSPARWKAHSSGDPGGGVLTVMTYNALAWHRQTEPVLAMLRQEDPDVVFLQEVNHTLAEALQGTLGKQYPYQILQPVDTPSGIALLSKYPLHPSSERLPDGWIGGPILATMDWNGQAVLLINFHMYPTTEIKSSSQVTYGFRKREAQARMLVETARRASQPVILGGDANSGPLSDAHRIFGQGLQDAWQEAGFGLGHTFPSTTTVPRSNRPKIGRWYAPPWLVRIDYILYTPAWQAEAAWNAGTQGVSDHRGIVARLRLRP